MNRIAFPLLCALFCLWLALGLPPAAIKAQAKEEGIAAVVNEDAVTVSDVQDRMKLIMVSSGLPQTDEIRGRIRPQILNMLVEETIKMQESRRLGIDVAEEEIDAGFGAIAKQNNMTPEQFRAVLVRSGIPERTLRDQIRSQIAWSKVIQNKLHAEVVVSDSDVQARLDQLKADLGKTEYYLAEIFLPVDQSGASEGEVRGLATKLSQEIRQGRAPFPAVARQFSQSAGASKGGDLGWLQLNELPDEVSKVVSGMKEGAVSDPIRTPRGYHIIALRKERKITQESIPPSEALLNQIGLERLDRLQQRYLLDLKSEAFIENRV